MVVKLSQEQIDKLINDVQSGEIQKNSNTEKYICCYCKKIMKLNIECTLEIKKILSTEKCRKNETGHYYYSEKYLKSLKGA